MHDIVLGNIVQEKQPESNAVVVQAVEKGSKQKPYCKFGIHNQVLDISSEEFVKKQGKDKRLDTLTSLAHSGEDRNCQGSGTVKCVFKRSILYRKFMLTDDRISNQLAIPTEDREAVIKLSHKSTMA